MASENNIDLEYIDNNTVEIKTPIEVFPTRFYFPDDIQGNAKYRETVLLSALHMKGLQIPKITWTTISPIDETGKKLTNVITKSEYHTEVVGEFMANILLPMPQRVLFDNQISWEQHAQGTTGQLISAVSTIYDELKNNSQENVSLKDQLLTKITDMAKNVKEDPEATGGILVGAIGTLGVATPFFGNTVFNYIRRGIEPNVNTITTVIQKVANQRLAQLFNGVPFRNFNFYWEFAPDNSKESLLLKTIIEKLRYFSYPALNKTYGDYVLDFPDYWTIDFLHIDNDAGFSFEENTNAHRYVRQEYIPKIRRCILKSISTNYTEQAWFSHEDGSPTKIMLELGFTEAEIITREAIKEGF